MLLFQIQTHTKIKNKNVELIRRSERLADKFNFILKPKTIVEMIKKSKNAMKLCITYLTNKFLKINYRTYLKTLP